jgi:hypothetical protein
MVETVGLELRTHHPVIEPVSAQARTVKFPMQRQGGIASPSGALYSPLTGRLNRWYQCGQNNRTVSAGVRRALCDEAFHCTGK